MFKQCIISLFGWLKITCNHVMLYMYIPLSYGIYKREQVLGALRIIHEHIVYLHIFLKSLLSWYQFFFLSYNDTLFIDPFTMKNIFYSMQEKRLKGTQSCYYEKSVVPNKLWRSVFEKKNKSNRITRTVWFSWPV